MMGLIRKLNLLICFLAVTSLQLRAQEVLLDGFESLHGWGIIKSDGVDPKISLDKGRTGNAVRLDYDFTKGTGFGGLQKLFPIDLPENYELTFYLKADSPSNNFEVKLLDSSGNNVWWVNNRNYEFPLEWKKIRIRKRHIQFAWGPSNDQQIRRIDRIEFTIASFVGGKGSVWIDDLKFEKLLPETNDYPAPTFSVTTAQKGHEAIFLADRKDDTYWQSSSSKSQEILIDFNCRREFGGLHIDWLKGHGAADFVIYLSEDGISWEEGYKVTGNKSDITFVRMPETEARYMRISALSAPGNPGCGIREIKFLEVRNSLTMNDFLIYSAKNSAVGDYPRYLLDQASYWTLTGVNNDVKEALINEDGMVEVDKGCFSIEPMINSGGQLFTWSDVESNQSMGHSEGSTEFDFVPSVSWKFDQIEFTTGITASGEANRNSVLDIRYDFVNKSPVKKKFEFYLLIRPYQVNPHYQFLNMSGGAGKIREIREQGTEILVDDKVILSQIPYTSFGAMTTDQGNPVRLLRDGVFPESKAASDPSGQATGVLKYIIDLGPGDRTGFSIAVPFYGKDSNGDSTGEIPLFDGIEKTTGFWRSKVGHIKFDLPPSADRIVNTYHSNLAYILVNRDRVGIQPGSRSYERSWIRDGALTSSALLKSGITTEVRDFIDWYAAHQYENGKVPCVVDFRGPDPVPENDSHGQFIYLIREYFNFTQDTAFLRSMNKKVLLAVDYIESLVNQRKTDHYKYGNDSVRAQYGLVPESISHEGYSAKPMHSYWDDFFIMKGLKDATEIQRILNEKKAYERLVSIRDTFRVNLYNSINLAMKFKQIDFIPGCAELGDFDATSTTIALTPCNELINLPKPQIYNTFNKYYDFFKNRKDHKIDWLNYTPYENRLIGSFIILDQPERAHELMEFFLNDQRPQGWNHWAEVVWKDYRTPRYIGDMPHTWVGSDFINAIRTLFVYENEYDQSLVLAAALYQEWIDAPEGMSVNHLPTYYGEIGYSIKKETDHYMFSITGDIRLPENGIKIRNFNGSKLPSRVVINGKDCMEFTRNSIPVSEVPAMVRIYY